MKMFISLVFLALAGCGSSDDDSLLATKAQLPPDNSAQVAALTAQVNSLQTQVSALKSGQDKLQLIGKVNAASTAVENNVRGVAHYALTNAVSFGPCADMGVLQGRGGSDTGNALASQFEIFKACTGYSYSISNLTGLLDIPPYLTWDGPNCTGNAYLEMDVAANTMNADAVKNGIVFQSPIDSTVFEIPAGEQPQQIMIQSSLNTRGGVCGVDQELRLVVHAVPNDSTTTGVPNSLVPGSWTTVAP